ncbi:salicylate 1-monooxygenase sala [Xylariaceae sp. FL1019]|nr:salicylate 1-monooxygenase sala [Xylariaceae sp. FL1019]
MIAKDKNLDIAIIGGGITGITLAIALMNNGIRVQVYEQGHGFSEIGAGVSFGPNSVAAMKACDPAIYTAFQGVATHNQWESKSNVFFDFIDGSQSSGATMFSLESTVGANSTHRGDFMEAMAELIPSGMAHFRKRLEDIAEDSKTGRLQLKFHDGTTAEADGVIGCDGIKSRTRAIMLGEDHPAAHASYAHMYCYRAVMPMERAVSSIGEERAKNACMWLNDSRHILTFPINKGKTWNLVAMVRDEGEWPDERHLTLPAKKEDAFKDFANMSPYVRKQLELVDDKVDRWALFDTAKNPLPTFNKDRIVVAGDAAHATTPHHGAGAGFGIEDSAILSHLLLDPRVKSPADLAHVFAAFDASRRERDQWLVTDSRATGDQYQWNSPDIKKGDWKALEATLKKSYSEVWNCDFDAAIKEAREDLGSRLGDS